MDELRGKQAVWRFGSESIAIRYATGWFKDPLLKKLGQCEVPIAAIASVDFRPGAGKKKGWVLQLHLREHADPYATAGAMLNEKAQPFRLTGPAKTELLAEYYSDQITFAIENALDDATATDPAQVATRLVPKLPLHITTEEGTATFDGASVRLVWSGSAATTRKRKEQRREFPLSRVAAAEWVPSDGWEYGYLRVVEHGFAAKEAVKPKHDFSCLLCEEGREGAATLLMAATITAYIWAGTAQPARQLGAGPEALPAGEPGTGDGDEEDAVYAQIERLGRLHADGFLTDDEFAAKKAELLDRL
ncbi:DUF4429 domain-containing protein [Nocardiopsis ansamitocini]|uniref:Uncharacterized protein n=1 Tax=Nocardiopsis ansamitocini TaxID=1670832 RepID=A0A9W6PAL8_9ACTN|nr:DUF4429 domain-containing protein [Nocardiopsis ansamitocini]GLU50033.1 hypothetical protein Nans01_43840 [Nocardiopsis ansamitocini]